MTSPQETAVLDLPLAEARHAAGVVAALLADGWLAEDQLNTCRLLRDGLSSANDELTRLAALSPALVEVQVVGSRAGQEIRLRRVNDRYEVAALPDALPASMFDDPNDQELAAAAWDRDPESALRLPMSWRISADVSFTRLLTAPKGADVRVCLHPQTIDDTIGGSSFLDGSRLEPSANWRRIYLALLGNAPTVNLGSLTLSGLPAAAEDDQVDMLTVPAGTRPLAGEAIAYEQLPHGLLKPNLVYPLPDMIPAEWKRPVARLASLAGLTVWCMLASECSVRTTSATLVFVGFKRNEVVLTSQDLVDQDLSILSLNLRTWAFSEASPDRLLAARQVISLYPGREVLDQSADIQSSAEIIYRGLRSDAVAEVVKSAREAQSMVMDAVRQSTKGAQDLAKSATERFLAALVAVASVVIANSSKVLSDQVSRELMLLVAGFLLLLAFFSLLIEGPLLSTSLRSLTSDLQESTTLLTSTQLERLTTISSVQATRKRIFMVRLIIASTYIATAVTIIIFGFPANYK